jgi:hypothetical protein
MRQKIYDWFTTTPTFKLLQQVFLGFITIEILLVIIREIAPREFYNFLIVLPVLLLVGYTTFSGFIYMTRGEVPFSREKYIAKGDFAITIGWILFLSSIVFIFFICSATIYMQFKSS